MVAIFTIMIFFISLELSPCEAAMTVVQPPISGRLTDEPVAEIVQCGEPTSCFARS
jgi:hypothetical protein